MAAFSFFLPDISKMVVFSSLCGTRFCEASSFYPLNIFVAVVVVIAFVVVITIFTIIILLPFIVALSFLSPLRQEQGETGGKWVFPGPWRWQKRAGAGAAASLPLGDSYRDRALPF